MALREPLPIVIGESITFPTEELLDATATLMDTPLATA